MKYLKQIVFVLLIVLLCFLIFKFILDKSVDLSNITLDGIRLGDSYQDIDVKNYVSTDQYPKGINVFNFEELRFITDKNYNIIRIHANVLEGIEVRVNSLDCSYNIGMVVRVLGNKYKAGWFDRQQQLKKVVYVDNENHTQATFVYDYITNRIVWVIMEVKSK